MKLVIASHAGVLGVNRKIFVSLAEKTGWDITLLVPELWKGDLIRELAFRQEQDENILKIIPLPVVFSGNGSLFYYRGLPKLESQPDLVLIDEEPWSVNALQLYQFFSKSKKVFYTKQNIKKTLPPPFHQIQNYIFRNSVGAFAVSDAVSEILRLKKYLGPIETLPHSYDPKLFFTSPPESSLKRLRIGYAGRLEDEKGIRVMIDAIRSLLLKKSFYDSPVDFEIIGNGALYHWVQKQIQHLPEGRVRCSPAVPHDQMNVILRTLDILILPSQTTHRWKEQFGRILVESWASGSAVIGSDSGEIPNLVKKSGGGLIFHEKSSDELAAKIEVFISDPLLLNKMKKAGLEYVTRTFTHEQVAQDLAAKLNMFFISAT